MSWRHAPRSKAHIASMPGASARPHERRALRQSGARTRAGFAALGHNFGSLASCERFQKLCRYFAVEQRVARLDAQKKAVATSQLEARHIEHGMIRRRQP